MHREDLLSHQSMPTPQGAGDEKVLETTGARRTGSAVPALRAVSRFQAGHDSSTAIPGGADDSVEVPGKTTHQTLETVDVAPMAGVQKETQGEAEEGEPPYRAARSGDIVMVIDGETLCVPEEDVPKVYYEEDDGQVLPTEQVHEGMQRELMKDLEVSERVLRTDVPSGKKIWSTRWCHRRKGAAERSRFVVRRFRDTDLETAFSGVPGLVVVRILLCISTMLESSAVKEDFSVVVHEYTFA